MNSEKRHEGPNDEPMNTDPTPAPDRAHAELEVSTMICVRWANGDLMGHIRLEQVDLLLAGGKFEVVRDRAGQLRYVRACNDRPVREKIWKHAKSAEDSATTIGPDCRAEHKFGADQGHPWSKEMQEQCSPRRPHSAA